MGRGGLAAGDRVAAVFYGASQLENAGQSPSSLVPLIAGAAMVAGLIIHQYLAKHPLMPARQLATTFPVFGIVTAVAARASAIGLTELVLTVVQKKGTPAALWIIQANL